MNSEKMEARKWKLGSWMVETLKEQGGILSCMESDLGLISFSLRVARG